MRDSVLSKAFIQLIQADMEDNSSSHRTHIISQHTHVSCIDEHMRTQQVKYLSRQQFTEIWMITCLNIWGFFGKAYDTSDATREPICAKLRQSDRQDSVKVAGQQMMLHAVTCSVRKRNLYSSTAHTAHHSEHTCTSYTMQCTAALPT